MRRLACLILMVSIIPALSGCIEVYTEDVELRAWASSVSDYLTKQKFPSF